MQDDSFGTGYRVTYVDFVNLLTEPARRGAVRPLVEKWFNCTVVDIDGQAQLKSTSGEYLSLSSVHEQIQADKDMQRTLYNEAMTLWR
jgi:hypothetical protein